MKRILIWDVPTRLFHWLFAISFAAAWLSSESDRWLSIHTFCGYLMLGLIGFRLIWGMAGGHYARFSTFKYSRRPLWPTCVRHCRAAAPAISATTRREARRSTCCWPWGSQWVSPACSRKGEKSSRGRLPAW